MIDFQDFQESIVSRPILYLDSRILFRVYLGIAYVWIFQLESVDQTIERLSVYCSSVQCVLILDLFVYAIFSDYAVR